MVKALCFFLWHYQRHEIGIVCLDFSMILKKYSRDICKGIKNLLSFYYFLFFILGHTARHAES